MQSLEYWNKASGADLCKLQPTPVGNIRRTKIVTTIGPVTQSVEMLGKLIDAGSSCLRMNFSHGNHEYHQQTIKNAREAFSKRPNKIVAIMLDTKGPEVRTGDLKGNVKEVALKKGETLVLTIEKIEGDSKIMHVDYQNITKVMKAGDTILIDDGLVGLTVEEVKEKELVCTVQNDGKLGSRKGVNLPGVNVDLPAVTEKDISDLKFGVKMGVDMVAASFIRKAQDVKDIRKVLGPKGANIKIISKIENQEGMEKFDEILEESDGIMVARGDLGVEIPIEQVAMCQKMMIAKCNVAGKPVITATQMLESMIENPRPTRAEATDIANAVFDGTDAVMLSGETAKGDYPVEAVATMARICTSTETSLQYNKMFKKVRQSVLNKEEKMSVTETITSSAVKITNDIDAKILLCITESGFTARLCAKYKPLPPIFAITQNKETARQLAISWNVNPVIVGSVIGTKGVIKRTIMLQKEDGVIKTGDLGVVVSGHKEGVPGATSIVKVITA